MPERPRGAPTERPKPVRPPSGLEGQMFVSKHEPDGIARKDFAAIELFRRLFGVEIGTGGLAVAAVVVLVVVIGVLRFLASVFRG